MVDLFLVFDNIDLPRYGNDKTIYCSNGYYTVNNNKIKYICLRLILRRSEGRPYSAHHKYIQNLDIEEVRIKNKLVT